jgi:hypothetical protein
MRYFAKSLGAVWQEFILRNAENKKLQSSSSKGELSKKSLTDFNLVSVKSFCSVHTLCY